MKKTDLIADLISLLSSLKMPLHNEKAAQLCIHDHLKSNNIIADRECYLSEKDIPDFFIDGILMEVKINYPSRKVYEQLERYSKYDQVECIILITLKPIGLPKEINSKPVYVINAGKAWM